MKRAATLIITLLLVSSFLSSTRGDDKGKVSPVNLKPGTYVAKVEQTTTAISSGETVRDDLLMRLKIISVDERGNVKAYITIHNHKGDVSGTVDPSGKLQLEGVLTHTVLPGEWKFKLTAVVKGDTLTSGEYTKISSRLRSRGEFKVAVLEEKAKS